MSNTDGEWPEEVDLDLIHELLLTMADKREQEGASKFRVSAYRRAADALIEYDGPLETKEDFMEFKAKSRGVGDKTLDKIFEVIYTGRLEELGDDQIEILEFHNKRKVMDLFMTVHGVGRARAEKWYDNGCRKLSDLDISLCSENIQVAIYYRDQYIQKIHYIDITNVQEELKRWLDSTGIEYKFAICGSYRRGKEYSSDIDILFQKSDTIDIIDFMFNSPFIGYAFSKGKRSMMGLINIQGTVSRIDIKVIDIKSWPFALLHFTGSGSHNVKMRKRAIELGMRLSEYGLKGYTGDAIKTERDIFLALNLPYVKPMYRD